jgi:hypothetical protein
MVLQEEHWGDLQMGDFLDKFFEEGPIPWYEGDTALYTYYIIKSFLYTVVSRVQNTPFCYLDSNWTLGCDISSHFYCTFQHTKTK